MFGLGTASGPGARPGRQTRTRPFGVRTCTASTPGVPCGATQSTLTSSSGASTVTPSQSLTRLGSPAISRQARENRWSAPALGCSSAGESHSMKKGSCGSAMRPLTPICFHSQVRAVGAVPVAGARLATEALLEPGDVVDGHDPARASRRRGRSGRGRLGRTAPCRTRGGRAPRRSRGRCGRPAAGSCCECRTAGGRPRRRTRCRAARRSAGRCRRGRRVRRRRRDGRGA